MMLPTFLCRLAPSGPAGFEGLIAKLLSQLTGLHFRLAKSGYQAGRDLGSREFMANVIAVETKRYCKSPLNNRELIGEVMQAAMETPDLDLWVLVTTRDVDALLVEQLTTTCSRLEVQFLHISDENEPLSTLATLCANAPDIVVKHLNGLIDVTEISQLRQQLQTFANSPEFEGVCQRLAQQLTSPFVGYSSWQHRQNKWFVEQLKSENHSHAAFGQILNVADESIHLIERRGAWQRLNDWSSSWTEHYQPIVFLGEEGDGKTWSVVSWPEQQVRAKVEFPPVIFVACTNVTNTDPMQLIIDQLTRIFSEAQNLQWQKRLERWLHSPTGADQPTLLLVLDGLNEQHSRSHWHSLLEALAIDPWRSRVGVILTCRIGYWQQFSGNSRAVSEYMLPPYDDQELNTALATYHLSRADISNNLLPLIRKPRYFDLMVKHRTMMAQSGDITIARLIYEDWKDRVRRKRHLSDLSNDEFHDLIRDLANKHLEQANFVRAKEIEAFMPTGTDPLIVLNELRTSSILHGEGTRLTVNKQYLVYGLGLLLVDELERAVEEGKSLKEVLASWLEPHRDMDIKAEICSFAALHALQLEPLARQIRVELLEAWVLNRNASPEIQNEFIAYMPQDAQAYVELAERVWSAEVDNRLIQELILKGFLYWQHNSNVQSALVQASEKWLGFVHLYGFSWQRGQNESKVQQVRQKIVKCVGHELEPGEFSYIGYRLTATYDDGLLRLGNLALVIISHLPRQPFVRALATGTLAEAVMGFPGRDEQYRWIFSTASQPLWESVKQEVQQLLAAGTLPAKQAAYRLLSYEGGRHARELQKMLPHDLFGKSPLYEMHEKDPCTSGFAWSNEECIECLQREDVKPWVKVSTAKDKFLDPEFELPRVFRKQLVGAIDKIEERELFSVLVTTSADLSLEEYEPAICRSDPHAIASFIKNVIRNITLREGAALNSLSSSLNDYGLLFSDAENDAIYQVWLTTNPNQEPTDDLNVHTEFFLFEQVLEMLGGKHQLVHLLYRHPNRHDLVKYTAKFRPVENTTPVLEGLRLTQDVNVTKRTLQFLDPHIDRVYMQHIQVILLPLLDHDDSYVRSLILRILYHYQEPGVINQFIQRDWMWHSEHHYLENHWGSLLICEYGSELPVAQVFRRVHPAYWGLAIHCRGYNGREVEQFAEMLDLLMRSIVSSKTDVPSELPLVELEGYLDAHNDRALLHRVSISRRSISTSFTFFSPHSSWGGEIGDFKRHHEALEESLTTEWSQTRIDTVRKIQQAQLNSNNSVFLMRFLTDGLTQLVKQYPIFVERWLAAVLDDTGAAHQLLLKAHAFYEALCEVLLREVPEEGIRLYEYLCKQDGLPIYVNADTKINLLDSALFKAPATNTTESVWQTKFEDCKSDLDLLELAVVAQQGKAKQWLLKWITSDCRSPSPLLFSRSVTLLGMLDHITGRDELTTLRVQEPDTWRATVVDVALKRWQRNAFAKHWFYQFLTIEDDVQAWAAFRLFLRCVDKRYWIWKYGIVSAMAKKNWHSKRMRFLHGNENTIRNRIRRNESELFKDKLFSQKIRARQSWPWI